MKKPTLGYTSRSEAVLALRRQGQSTKHIADVLDIEPKTVLALEHSAMRAKKRQRRPAEEHGRTVLFPTDILDRLRPHAARRGIHTNHLARLIVETALDERLIDALLDDEAEVFA